MSTFRHIAVIVPASLVDKANDILQALGHGYPCITKPMRSGTGTATDAGSCWPADDALIERLRTLPTPAEGWPAGITETEVQAVRDAIMVEDSAKPEIVDEGGEITYRSRGEGFAFFDRVAKARGLEHSNTEAWLASPVMNGDRTVANGRTVESIQDYNPWPPGVARWRPV